MTGAWACPNVRVQPVENVIKEQHAFLLGSRGRASFHLTKVSASFLFRPPFFSSATFAYGHSVAGKEGKKKPEKMGMRGKMGLPVL